MSILIILLMIATAVVLLLGIATMIRGGEFNQKYGNKMMVARVSLQAATIALVGLAFLFSKH